MLIQDLYELKIDWDQPLDGAIPSKWQALISDLQEAQPISIPRSYFNGVNGEVRSYQLYGFRDAFVRAYAALTKDKDLGEQQIDEMPEECVVEMKATDRS